MGTKGMHISVGMRVLAGILALAMLFSTVALLLTRIVQPKNDAMTGKAVEDAFAALRQDDEYLNASAVSRVGMLLAQLRGTPKSADEYEQLASIYAGRGEYGEAAVLYQDSVDATDRADTATLANRYLKLASAYVLNGELELAAAGYRESLAHDPTSPYGRLLLAQVYIEQQAYRQAAVQLIYYLTLVPEDMENRRLLGNLYEAQEEYALAYTHYDRVYQATQTQEDRLSCARTAAMLGDDERVIELYTACFANGEDTDGSGHYLRGISYIRREDYAAAKKDLLDAVKLGFSDRASCYTYLTICTYFLNEFSETIQYGEEAAAFWQMPDGECLQRMGLSALQLARYPEAEDYLLRSLAASPALAENHFFLANVYLLTQDYESARASFGHAIDAGYLLQQSYYNRAVCSLELGDYASAAEDLQSCIPAGNDAEIIASARDFLSQLGVTGA